MSMSGREMALLALEKCRRNRAWSDEVLGSLAKSAGADPRETALAARICYGVQQNMALCDFYIDYYSNTKTRDMEPKVLDILRVSVYQLLFMDRIPARAAVNEAVNLCKKRGGKRSAGLVNAVLRQIAVHRDALPPIPEPGTVRHLSIRYSHPEWYVRELISELGYEGAGALLAANNREVPLYAQVNRERATTGEVLSSLAGEGIAARAHEWLADCVIIEGGGNPAALGAFLDGSLYIQDPAARLAVMAAGCEKEKRLLDVCAAPGGKSFGAAIQMQNSGYILAGDIHEKKLRHIQSGARRMGLDIIETRKMDAKAPPEELWGQFDVVLADVPCSGLGIIRKKPDVRYKPYEQIERLPEVQLDILRGASQCVRPGGTLLYSTCTTRRAENQEVAERFLDSHGGFEREEFILPGPVGPSQGGMVTLWPHLHDTDGFFICKMRLTK